ncbi:unnamed protein product [Blepharisma stoltei]|uniref:Transposase n=1 Tax=Blepharisma stoltei TaxID=1481888 RepID=A0AAU9JDD5_9CILI|nr:unnamed protein product [Blepharisma stoltei]
MTDLYPENHNFFAFVRDCVIALINKVGTRETSVKLGVSIPALELILQSREEAYTPRTYKKERPDPDVKFENLLEEVEGEEDEIRILPDGRRHYPAGFKKKVVNAYMSSKDFIGTAKQFDISSTLLQNWIFKVQDGENLNDNPGKKR